LNVEVHWSDAALGRSGRAIIKNGALSEQAVQSHAPAGAAPADVRADADGEAAARRDLRALARVLHATSSLPTNTLSSGIAGPAGSCELSASDGVEADGPSAGRFLPACGLHGARPHEPIAEAELRELDRLAQNFERWDLFEESDPAETAVERAAFEAYGYPLRAANLRS